MRNVAVLANQAKSLVSSNPSIETVDMHTVPVTCGVVVTRPPRLDPKSDEHRLRVVVRIKAFSCNYRDQTFIIAASRKARDFSCYVIGSDFMGEVVAIGADVRTLAVGDRVIGNNAYHGLSESEPLVRQGVPSNHASAEYQVLSESQVIKIPPSMPDDKAAAFSINSQTAYSMVRRIGVSEGDHVLVTAARSNTSLATIGALRKHQTNVYALTTSRGYEPRFAELGVAEVIHNSDEERLIDLARSIGGFQCVVDPFFDLHLKRVAFLLAPGGRYTSCGVWRQYQDLLSSEARPPVLDLSMPLSQCISNNIQLIFNCLGSRSDLAQAIEDYAAGDFDIVIDSTYSGNQVGAFLGRTFTSADRFGKVVYRYA